jgi:hypothetical protein
MGFSTTFAKDLARRLFGYAGGILISKKIYRQILLQRKNALEGLVELERAKLRSGLACVVFSKDRPLQLFTLLHTYFDKVQNPAPITVIYDASNPSYADAYLEIAKDFACRAVSVSFVKETGNFRECLIQTLDKIDVSALFFLVDDIVFIRPLDLSLVRRVSPSGAVLSLRHSPHLQRSYTCNAKVNPPRFVDTNLSPELVSFNWFERGYEWSAPWSVDGHVLSTAEVRVMARISEFKAPNSFEVALNAFNDLAENRIGICFKESKILNLPINRVQEEVRNLSGSVSCEYLLDEWNNGMMIDTQMFDNHTPISPHEEHLIKLKSRPCARA